MGNHLQKCCPCFFNKQKSQDSLSDVSVPTVREALQPAPIKQISKKRLKKQVLLRNLQRQQSSYFNNTQKIKLQQITNQDRIIPFNVPRTKAKDKYLKDVEVEHASQYSKIKQRIKTQINKISTMDEEDSVHDEHIANLDFYDEEIASEKSDCHQQSQIKKSKNNKTFNCGENSIMLSMQFRTEKGMADGQQNLKQKISKLEKQVENQQISEKYKLQVTFQIANLYFEMSQMQRSEEYCLKCLKLLKQNKQLQCIVQITQIKGMLGCISMGKAKIDEAISYFLQVIRLQVIKNGAESIKLVQIYYWIGQCYLKINKISLARDYLIKSVKYYSQNQIQDIDLLRVLYFNLANVYHLQDEYAQADKYYAKAAKITQGTQNSKQFCQILLKLSQNLFCMDCYRQSMLQYNRNFRAMRKLNLSNAIIHEQAYASLIASLRVLQTAKITQKELQSVIKIVQEILPKQQQIQILRIRLRTMQKVLYK